MAELSSATKEHAHKTPGPGASAAKLASVNDHGPEVDVGVPEEGVVARHAALMGDPRLGSPTGAQRMRFVQRLQRGYGNAYVARLVQRAVAEPPVAAPATPQQDPKFVAVEQKIGQTAKQEKQHPPAKAKAAEAQAAAQGPPNDVASQAAEKQVDKMDQQKPGEFDKKAFIAAVKKAIDASAPKNLEEADDFKKSGKAGQVKGEVSGMVAKGKQDSEGPIKKANTEAPDTSGAKPKVATPMGEEKPGAAPGDPGAAKAIPSPKTAAETSMAAGPAQVNQEMSQAGVTEEQLKNSNEPQFTDAAAAKQSAEAHSATAPGEYKAAETQTLDKAGADAKGAASTGLQGMHGQRTGALGAVGGQKGGAKGKDEAKRAEVALKIETIFNQTKTEVTTILEGLDAKVNAAFDGGEKEARAQFETFVDQKMSKYKRDRYLGVFGPELWLKDKLLGMPSEVNAFYQDGRNLYLSKMEGVISSVADVVGGELGKAKARIALGKQQVKEFVASQPKELQQVAKEAEQQIGSKFDELEGEVNSKQEALVQTLADKYVAARGELDSRIDALKAENTGLVDKAKDAIGGVIKTIMQLKDMLLGVLAKAANVIGDIIKDPIKFLGNLVSAIKMGLNQFGANITKHLKAALMGWLFGTLGEAGIQLPESFDLKGILSLILQVLGLTYENVRAIAVKIAGEKVVAYVEGTVTFFTTLAKEGPAGLWQWIKDKIAELNIKEMVLGAIKDFVITKIITAGITWLISMLNPAAAFIKACKMIYDVIMFIVERGAQIMEFVNSVLDGIGAIVAGSLGSAANLVENSLAKVLPLAIAFLASLLGVGGIAEKIKEIIEKIRAPITKLITAVVGPILKPLKKLYEKGAKFVKGLAEKGKDALKKGADKVKGMFGKRKADDRTPEQKQADLDHAVADAEQLEANPEATPEKIRARLPGIKNTYRLVSLALVDDGEGTYHIEGKVNPERKGKTWRRPADLPSIDKVTFEWQHIYDGHWEGTPVQTRGNNTVFTGLSQGQIQTVVKDAYKNMYAKLQTQKTPTDNRIRVRGASGNWTVEFWVNKTTKTVESAYPIFGS